MYFVEDDCLESHVLIDSFKLKYVRKQNLYEFLVSHLPM